MKMDEGEVGIEMYEGEVGIGGFLTFTPQHPPPIMVISENDNDIINNTITFSINVSEWDGFEFKQSKEMLKINKDGFFIEEKKVEDINNVYDQFSKWITYH